MATVGGGGPVPALIRLFPTVTLSGAQASISFPGIPGGYAALFLILQGRGDTAAVAVGVQGQFNGDSGTDYNGEQHYGVGSSSTAADFSNQTSALLGQVAAASAPAGAAGMVTATIPGYAGTTFRKTLHASSGVTNADTTSGHVTYSIYGEWKSTAAITSLLLFPAAGNFVAGTTATLYGVR